VWKILWFVDNQSSSIIVNNLICRKYFCDTNEAAREGKKKKLPFPNACRLGQGGFQGLLVLPCNMMRIKFYESIQKPSWTTAFRSCILKNRKPKIKLSSPSSAPDHRNIF
jgi:hypothetical protein